MQGRRGAAKGELHEGEVEKWDKDASRKPQEERFFLKFRVFPSGISIQRVLLGHKNLSVTGCIHEERNHSWSLDMFLMV